MKGTGNAAAFNKGPWAVFTPLRRQDQCQEGEYGAKEVVAD